MQQVNVNFRVAIQRHNKINSCSFNSSIDVVHQNARAPNKGIVHVTQTVS